MKKVSLLLMFVFALGFLTFGQLGTATVTYNLGDIETDKDFTWYSGTQSSDCPGMLTVNISVGATILSTDVSYDMTSDENSTIAKQKSHFRCVSPGGLAEPSMTNAPYIYTPGTQSYSRTGLDIANGVVGGGDIEFELHAGASYYFNYCSIDSVKVDNNTWTVTITYIPAGFPAQAINPTPGDGGFYIGLDDDLAWDFGADTDNYDVYFGTDNPPTTKVVDFASAGASGSYDPGTMNETETYYWKIVSHNTNGYTEGPVWSFTTQCGSFMTPFTEDFESVTIPELPYCWTSIVNSTSPSAVVETSDYYGNNAPQCLKLYNGNDAGATLIFVSPQIDLGSGSLADKMAHFYLKGFSYPYLTIGTMSDPTDEATFSPYESFLVYDSHTEHDVYFNSYVGTDTYVAFKLDASTSYQEAYIDDITIDDIPSCIKPADFYADNMTINSAWLNWTDLNGASSWNIEYGLAGFTPTGIPSVSGVSNPHQITGLSSATEYDFYIQADCGGGDLSDWSGPVTFLTTCDFYTVPLNENFDASPYLPVCWTSIIQTGDGWTINGVHNYNSYSPLNCYHMENGWDQNSNLILALPPFSTLSDKMVKFYAYNNTGSSDLEVGTMSNPSDANTFVPITSVTTSTSYQEYEVWFNTYTGSDEYMAIKHGNGSAYLGIYVDDITVEELPSCLQPSNLYVDNITTNSAQFHWTESGSAPDWIIEVGSPGFAPGTGTYLFQYNYTNPVGSDQYYDLSGLTSATSYDVYVQSDCGSGDYSSWSGPVTFLTSFESVTLPVYEDFESGMGITGNDPANGVDWAIATDLQHSGINSVHNVYDINNDNVLYMLGTFDLTANADVMLSFWHIAKTEGNCDHCYVEISTDGGSTYDQLPISTYAGSGNYREEGLSSNPEGPCFDEDSYPDWGTSTTIPENTWWKKEYFNLTDYNIYDNVVIRLRLVSNSYTNRAGWWIDDIAVEALGAPAFYADPLAINGDASVVMPIANADLTMGNTGNFPTTYTANVVYSETDLLNENFDAGIPGDWIIINNGNNAVTWIDTTDRNGYNFDGTSFAWADGYKNNVPAANTMDDELITPVINASGYTAILLEFDQAFDSYYNAGDTAYVYVFDGTNWIEIYKSGSDDGKLAYGQNGIHKVYDVSAYANANFQVKFHYTEDDLGKGYYFAIDNVRLRASMSALGWLTVDGAEVTSGVAMPDADNVPSIVDVQMDATGYALGAYTAEIEITSADPGNPSVTVPVTMNVVSPQVVQEYTLGIGYQFISTRIIPEDMDMQLICNDILDNLEFVRNSGGFMLRKIGPNWINSIGDWVNTEGYLFKMIDTDEFSISGEVIDPQTQIPLVEGYQFVSFLPENQTDALVAFNDILDNLDFVRNTAGLTVIKIGPNWINGIGDLMPGEGYLVKMNAADILIYPVTDEKFTGTKKIKPEYFNFEGGNAAEPVYTMYIDGLQIGDEVAAYNENVMVGAMKVISENVFDNSLAVFSTLNSGQGYVDGNPITLKVWSSGNIVPVDFTMESMFDSYISNVYPDNDGEFSVVNITKGVTLTGELLVYPNPATDEINISSPSDISNVSIINYVGQSVYSSKVNSSNVQINTNNFEAGIYIIRIQTCKGIKTKKIIIE